MIPLVLLPFSAFSPTRIADVRTNQEFRCGDCGSDAQALQVHHKVPQRFYGTDREVNAVALCTDCHRKWDTLADEGIVYPGISYADAEPRCFENPQVRLKIIAQFAISDA